MDGREWDEMEDTRFGRKRVVLYGREWGWKEERGGLAESEEQFAVCRGGGGWV